MCEGDLEWTGGQHRECGSAMSRFLTPVKARGSVSSEDLSCPALFCSRHGVGWPLLS